jgi:hypothetical protein
MTTPSKQINRKWSPPGPVSKAFFESPGEVCIFVGPVGSGKTSTTINKLLTLAALQRRSPDGVRYSRFVITRSTMQRLLSSTLPSFEEWLGGIGAIRKTSPIQKTIVTGDINLHLDFLGIDQLSDVARIMGANVSAIVIDEAREISNLHAILGELITRAGRFPQGGPSFPTRAILLSNCSDKSHDLHKLAISNVPEGFEVFLAPPAMLPDRVTVNPAAENLKNLTPGYYRMLQRTLPADRFAVEVMCEWEVLTEGKPLVPEFRSSTHVSPAGLMPLRGAPLLVGLDPGAHPAAIIGAPLVTERGEIRWEIYRELIAENIVSSKFAATLREFVERQFPDNKVAQVFIDPHAYDPSDRDDEKIIAELYASITGWPVKAPASNLVDVQLEALRGPFGFLVDGGPAIVVDASCTTLIAALAGKVAYREAVSGLEKVTTDMVIKRHPWHDAFMAATYLLLGGGGYAGMRDLVKTAKRERAGWKDGFKYDKRTGKWWNNATGTLQDSPGPQARMARDIDFPLFGEQ